MIACVSICTAAGLTLRYGSDILHWVERQSALRAGSPAPDFSIRALDGQTIRLSQYRGQPVLLTFAASWCPACREEAPYQQALHLQHPELSMLLVDSQEQDVVVRGFANEFGMTFPVLLDPSGALYLRYRVGAIPTTFFIDSQGIVRHVEIGNLTEALVTAKLPLIGVEP